MEKIISQKEASHKEILKILLEQKKKESIAAESLAEFEAKLGRAIDSDARNGC